MAGISLVKGRAEECKLVKNYLDIYRVRNSKFELAIGNYLLISVWGFTKNIWKLAWLNIKSGSHTNTNDIIHEPWSKISVAYLGPLPTHSSHIELAGPELGQNLPKLKKVLNNQLM